MDRSIIALTSPTWKKMPVRWISLPNIGILAIVIIGQVMISSMDGLSGYNQINLVPLNIEKLLSELLWTISITMLYYLV